MHRGESEGCWKLREEKESGKNKINRIVRLPADFLVFDSSFSKPRFELIEDHVNDLLKPMVSPF